MWNILDAIEGRGNERFSPVMRMGLIGAPLLIRAAAQLHWSDLNLLAVPGLKSIGFITTIHLFDSLEALCGAIRRRSAPYALFALSEAPGLAEKPGVVEDHAEDAEAGEAYTEANPVIVGQALVVRATAGERDPLLWRTTSNSDWVARQPNFGSQSWALISLKKAQRTGLRSTIVTAALLRWTAFAEANPDRLLIAADVDQLTTAALFLTECAGNLKSPASTRLSRSAAAFRSGNVGEAFDNLKQAVLLRTGISASLRAALLRTESNLLTDTERRELIYMARAGAPGLKVLAVRRLAADPNYEHSDTGSTLEQMRYDSNDWVRRAAVRADC